MRLPWVAGLTIIAATVAIARPDLVSGLYQQLYPSDPAQRRALDQCFLENQNFDRFDPAARAACYRHNLPSYQSAAADPASGLAAPVNFVDQWRADGQGHLPQNDIRAEQRTRQYLQPRGAASIR
jgi:hypothetical protein